MLDLGGSSATARAINNQAWIVGQSTFGGQVHATLWIAERTPAEQLDDLIALVQSFDLKRGIANSLDVKLQNVQKALSAAILGNRPTACSLLNAFINEAEDQSGSEITPDQAVQLINAAKDILAALGC